MSDLYWQSWGLGMWEWFIQIPKRHPFKWAVGCFLFGSLPQWVSSIWSLFDERPLADVIRPHLINMSIPEFSPYWITATVGAAMFAWLVYELRRSKKLEEPIVIGFMDDGIERFDQSKVDLIDSLYNHLVTTLIPEFDKYGLVTGWEQALSRKPKSDYMETVRQFRLSVSTAFSDLLDIYNSKPFYDDIKEVVESFRPPFKEFGDNSAKFFVLMKDKLDDVPSERTVSLIEGEAEKMTKCLGPCDSALKKIKKDLEEMRKQEMAK